MLWSEFLETVPANVDKPIDDLFVVDLGWIKLNSPKIKINCWSKTCDDLRIFEVVHAPGDALRPGDSQVIDGTILYK
jgi:hypothetical protein